MIKLMDLVLLPDWLIRLGMRRLMAGRWQEERQRYAAQPGRALQQFVQETLLHLGNRTVPLAAGRMAGAG